MKTTAPQELVDECRFHKCFTARDIRVKRGLPQEIAEAIACALSEENRPTDSED